MKLGSTDITKGYLGSTEITKAYLGGNLVLDGGTDADAVAYINKLNETVTLSTLEEETITTLITGYNLDLF